MDALMTTAAQVLGERVAQACTDASAAEAAGIAAVTWSSLHVFRGFGGFIGGRNRGRLPFVEWQVQGQGFAPESTQGGTCTMTVALRVHVGGANLAAAEDLSEEILAAILTVLRDESADNLYALGDDQISAMQPGPWGHVRESASTVEVSFGRDSFERT